MPATSFFLFKRKDKGTFDTLSSLSFFFFFFGSFCVLVFLDEWHGEHFLQNTPGVKDIFFPSLRPEFHWHILFHYWLNTEQSPEDCSRVFPVPHSKEDLDLLVCPCSHLQFWSIFFFSDQWKRRATAAHWCEWKGESLWVFHQSSFQAEAPPPHEIWWNR